MAADEKVTMTVAAAVAMYGEAMVGVTISWNDTNYTGRVISTTGVGKPSHHANLFRVSWHVAKNDGLPSYCEITFVPPTPLIPAGYE